MSLSSVAKVDKELEDGRKEGRRPNDSERRLTETIKIDPVGDRSEVKNSATEIHIIYKVVVGAEEKASPHHCPVPFERFHLVSSFYIYCPTRTTKISPGHETAAAAACLSCSISIPSVFDKLNSTDRLYLVPLR